MGSGFDLQDDISGGMVVNTPVIGREKREDQKFKVLLSYIESLRSARDA